MQAMSVRDTDAELAVRAVLFRMGLRYRVDYPPLPGSRRRADVVFTRRRVAVHIDGCFWHGCPRHGSWPKANAGFWREKILNNRRRDRETDRRLRRAGWLALRFWAHEDPERVARRIAAEVRRRRVP
jgi:DNA mismatch endonuclease (patch repair protein)